MTRLLPILLPLLLGAGIPDAPPGPVTLTAAEQALVDKRKIAVRLETSDQGGYAVGIMDTTAPPDALWNALMDLKARVAEIGSLKSCEIYEETGDSLAARWVIGVMGVSIQFHIQYRTDRDNGFVRYWLDTGKPNDIVAVQGAYHLYAHGNGSRLVYMSRMDSGRRVPQWIKNWLATGSLTEQMTGIRTRAESGP